MSLETNLPLDATVWDVRDRQKRHEATYEDTIAFLANPFYVQVPIPDPSKRYRIRVEVEMIQENDG